MTGRDALKLIKPLVFEKGQPALPATVCCYPEPGAKEETLKTFQAFYPYFAMLYDTFFVIEKTKGPAFVTRINETGIRVEYYNVDDYEWLRMADGKIAGDAGAPLELELIT